MSQVQPSDGDQQEAVEALLAASRVMTAVVARTLATMEQSVSLPQLRILVMLHYEGARNLKSIADALGVNPSNASRACDKLVGAGLVNRGSAAHDRRNVDVSLTSAGRHLVDALMVARGDLLAQAVSEMDPDERRQLVQSLGSFLASVESSGLAEQLAAQKAAVPAWVP